MAHSELFNCPAPLPLDSAHRSILKLGHHTTRSASRQAPLVELVRPLVELDFSCVSQMTVKHELKSSHTRRHDASKALFPMFVIP